MKNSSSRIRGFSLLELMVVMLIIGIVAAFVVPSASTILNGSQVVQASRMISDQFNLARQFALSTNHPVELRLIRYADPEVPGEVLPGQTPAPGSGSFRAVQVVEDIDTMDSSGVNPVMMRVALDKPQLFPQAIVMDTSDALSPLIYEAQVPSSTNGIPNPTQSPSHMTPITNVDPSLPRNIGYNYDYVYFRFNSDGSTNLPAASHDSSGCWFVTLRNLNDQSPYLSGTSLVTGQGGTMRPVNFFTLLVDPVSGTLKQFRPGI